jgi:hypothetical protein
VLDPIRPHNTFVFLDKKKDNAEGKQGDDQQADDLSPDSGHKNQNSIVARNVVLGILNKMLNV